MAAFAMVGMGTFVSCDDYENDLTASLQGQVNGLESVVQTQITSLSDLISQVDAQVQQLEQNSTDMNYTLQGVKNTLRETQDQLSAAQSQLDGHETQIETLLQTSADLETGYNDLSGKVAAMNTALNNRIDSLGNVVKGLGVLPEQITGLIRDAAAALTLANYAQDLAKADSARIDEVVEQAAANLQTAKDYAQQAVDSACTKLREEFNASLDEIEAAYMKADSILRDSIDSLRTDVDSLRFDVDGLLEKYERLNQKIASLITGIIVQGAESPVFGYMNLPVDIRSNILATYYGTVSSNGVEFPTLNSTYYAFAEQAKDLKNLQLPFNGDKLLVDADEVLVNQQKSKLYLTVNPANVDFKGVEIELVNSIDEKAAGYELSELQHSDKLLTFGITRSGAPNFYESEATVTDPVAAKPNIDVTALKGVARNFLNRLTQGEAFDITEAVSVIYDNLNNVMPAYGVKISWDDADVDGNPTRNSVYSEYNVAATAIPALSYAFLKDGLDYTLPRIPTLESLGLELDHFNWEPVEGFPSEIETSVTLTIPDVHNVTLNGRPDVDLTREWGYLPDGTKYLANVNINGVDMSDVKVEIGETEETFYVTVPMDEFSDIIDQLNSQVSGMMGTINDLVDRLSGMVQSVDTKFIGRMNGFIERIEKLIQNPNQFLQICLLYENESGNFTQMTTEKMAPSIIKLGGAAEGAIALRPTSYTAEIFAPAYKKYVAVTNAWDLDGTTEISTEFANEGLNMNTVLEGSETNVVFQVDKPGIYEIVYSAVDFSGMVVTRTFYVKVVA